MRASARLQSRLRLIEPFFPDRPAHSGVSALRQTDAHRRIIDINLESAFGPRMNAKNAKKNRSIGVSRGIPDLIRRVNGMHTASEVAPQTDRP
jgi:hypothetical protein